MKDPFDVSAYQILLNRHIGAVQSAKFWLTRNQRYSEVRADQDKALARLHDESRELVDAVTDFIRRHCEFAVRRLNAIKDLEGPSPFGPELEAKLRRSLEAVEGDSPVGAMGPVLQAVREADGEYQLQLESLRLKLAEKTRKTEGDGGARGERAAGGTEAGQEYDLASAVMVEADFRKRPADTAAVGEQAEVTGGTTWQAVAEFLEGLRIKGERFTSQEDYAERLGCSPSTVNKAIHRTPTLEEWAKRPVSSTLWTKSLEGAVLDNTPEQREADPAGAIEPADIDVALQYLIEHATPEERARIHAMSPAEKRKLAELAYQDPDTEKRILDQRG